MVSVQELQAATLSPLPLGASETFPNRNIRLEAGPYVARVAITEAEREATYRLRFIVFNLEMNEGLESAYVDGLDKDRYDDVCDHLIIEEKATGAIVGTYRLQMGDAAGKAFGYYSEQEFSFAPFEHMRSQVVELGRACIHRAHRSPEVLHLLWRGIARYALANGGRYMMGCCSLNSQDAQMGHAVYAGLQSCMVEPELRTVAMAAYKIEMPMESVQQEKAPKLLRAYLAIGAKICSEPAIDREFKTIDFLTLLDLHTLHPRVAARFLEAN